MNWLIAAVSAFAFYLTFAITASFWSPTIKLWKNTDLAKPLASLDKKERDDRAATLFSVGYLIMLIGICLFAGIRAVMTSVNSSPNLSFYAVPTMVPLSIILSGVIVQIIALDMKRNRFNIIPHMAIAVIVSAFALMVSLLVGDS